MRTDSLESLKDLFVSRCGSFFLIVRDLENENILKLNSGFFIL